MSGSPFNRRMPVGAEVQPDGGVHFRVWAPARRRVRVIFDADGRALELARETDGYFAGSDMNARAGDRYRIALDDGEQRYPDPTSRYQPDGVHGPSEIVDASSFRWTDAEWRGITAAGNVVYELHIGCFTPQGTWLTAIAKLPFLREVGITCIELMPVNAFAGRWNWGYDGVNLFAPTENYGSPDDMRRFIDAAHAHGIAVILDVVYNHFGPDGNYLHAFSDAYFTDKYENAWGKSINFDGPDNGPVREYFIANARYWVEEFHVDGYRYDATQAVLDDSPEHILTAISRAARDAAQPRTIFLVNENEPQDTKLVRPIDAGGMGMDALWNDDFHHTARVALTGRRDAYFTDYKGSAQELLSAIKWGYLYQGQHYRWQGKRRGTPGLDLPPTAFINYIQNHDQIANYAHGERLTRHTSLQQLRAITALMLLAPQTPMLFMGQEWAASARFMYFADHCGDLPSMIATGRKREVSQFPSVGSPEMLASLPEPCDPKTFERCKLDWSELDDEYHQQFVRLHRDLLSLRRNDRILNRVQTRGNIDGAVVGPWAFVLRFFGEQDDDRLLLINLDADENLDIAPEPLLAPPRGKGWSTLLSTEHPRYGGNGHVSPETRGESWRLAGENWRLLSRCTTVLRAVPESVVHAEEAEREFALNREKGES